MADTFLNRDNKLYKVNTFKNTNNICLIGNPNTGKSSIFNSLTGLRQHTGNWSGKTVTSAYGEYRYNEDKFTVIDLPGVYSILTSSKDEEVSREYICFGNYDVIVVVCDMTSLERNFNILLQILSINSRVILCLNLFDEAKSKKIKVDVNLLEEELKIPIVVTSARSNYGINELKEKISDVILNKDYEFKDYKILYDEFMEEKISSIQKELSINNLSNFNLRWLSERILDSEDDFFEFLTPYMESEDILLINKIRSQFSHEDKQKNREYILGKIYDKCTYLKNKFVIENKNKNLRDKKIDDIVTSKKFGIPIMLGILALVLFITISFANIPSGMLSDMFFYLEGKFSELLVFLRFPTFLHDMLVYGLFRVTGWVISVMLPPMAIFFPMFTFLESLGYLPRVAFNMDSSFRKAGCHGKQSLTMCMGLGCNCAGIIGTRIIESPRERMIAILTNNFVPCNGRFPTLIVLASIFFSTTSNMFVNSFITAIVVTLIVVIGVGVTLFVSSILSKTLLKGEASSFSLELPPYRKPKLGSIIYTSLIDRTLFVLGRAVMVAAPFGIIIWLFSNIFIGDLSITAHLINFLNPVGVLIGLDGVILVAFLLGFPANEIVMPILLMCYLSTGTLIELETANEISQVLRTNGWTILTCINVMLFSLLHFPCSTAVWTMKKETGSAKWTILGVLIPTVIAFILCFIVNLIFKLFIIF